MSNFRTIDRQTGFLLPPSVDEWLPEKHLARFVVEVIEGLDLRAMSGSYRGSGSASYHPRMLLGILVYGYATGVFSSRKLERATYDSVAFRFVAANDHPDHDTIAAFRRRFLKEIEGLFVQVLLLAREMGVLNMGTIGLDGTKIHANASRHSALSYEHAGKIEAQLQAEVAELMAKAEAADAVDIPDGMLIPDELARREERLRKIAEARTKIEARAKERRAREQAEHEAKLAARDAKTAATGKKPGGKPPQPLIEGPSVPMMMRQTPAGSLPLGHRTDIQWLCPKSKTARLLQQPALIRRTAGGRRSFQRRPLRRLNFWAVPVAAHSRRKTSCASLGRSTALRASPGRSARSCAARGFTRQRCRTGGVSAPRAPSKR
jgi:transposase